MVGDAGIEPAQPYGNGVTDRPRSPTRAIPHGLLPPVDDRPQYRFLVLPVPLGAGRESNPQGMVLPFGVEPNSHRLQRCALTTRAREAKKLKVTSQDFQGKF